MGRVYVFVSRDRYNRLVSRYPSYMGTFWPEWDKSWSLGGAGVEIPEAHLDTFSLMLEAVS